jgi:hypothetical protein
MITMVTDVIPAQPADLSGLSLTQIAALPTLEEILERVVPGQPSVPVASFGSAI